jgi:hypothetical protein
VTVDKLAGIYVEHCNFFSPIFSSKHEFLNMLEPLYDDDISTPNERINRRFRAFIVLGASILLLNRVDFSVSALNTSVQLFACLRTTPRDCAAETLDF